MLRKRGEKLKEEEEKTYFAEDSNEMANKRDTSIQLFS